MKGYNKFLFEEIKRYEETFIQDNNAFHKLFEIYTLIFENNVIYK
jgi:hypothetical protein